MNIFLINLDRSTDRLAFFAAQASELGLGFERLPAVDGITLSEEELEAYTSNPFEFQPMTRFEVACFLSHRNSWEQVVRRKLPHAAVFEDDVIVSSNTKRALDCIDNCRAFDVIKIETTLRRIVCRKESDWLDSGHRLSQLKTWHGGAAGYVVSLEGARKLLDSTASLADQVDQSMFNPLSRVSSSLRILQCVPALCVQQHLQYPNSPTAFGSMIDRQTPRRRLFRHGPLIDARRLVKKQQERLRRFGLAMLPFYQELIVPFEGAAPTDSAVMERAA